MYKVNLQEKDFLESLQSFSLERGVTVPKEPVWRGKRISIFRFYNLVQQHGGFENVSKMYCLVWEASVSIGKAFSALRANWNESKKGTKQWVLRRATPPKPARSNLRAARVWKKLIIRNYRLEIKAHPTFDFVFAFFLSCLSSSSISALYSSSDCRAISWISRGFWVSTFTWPFTGCDKKRYKNTLRLHISIHG